MHWKSRIYSTAYNIANSFKDNPKVGAIAIGGSVAKGTVWKHSDLELCLIVKEHIDEEYFNYIDGMGVEIIQVLEQDMIEFVESFTEPDTKLLRFPTQIYKCRAIHDPEGYLAKFKKIYDANLFCDAITKLNGDGALKNADMHFCLAQENYIEYPRTSLAHLRIAVNELLLAYYWRYKILPRSQNRTVYLLKKNSKTIGHDYLYDAFVDIFSLRMPISEMRSSLHDAKDDISKVLSTGWGKGAPEFLEKAVDGNLEWGYPKSIIYVYKWCMHILQCNNETIDVYDTDEFKTEYPRLSEFLDFEDVSQERLVELIKQYQNVRSLI